MNTRHSTLALASLLGLVTLLVAALATGPAQAGPEPSTFVLAVVGIAGLVAWRWRRLAIPRITSPLLLTALAATMAVLAVSQTCWAELIAVNFDAALVPSGGEQPLPIYVDNQAPSPDSVRFRFTVPDATRIESLNSVGIFVDVFDDGDNQDNEAGRVLFSLSGQPNLDVAMFDGGLNGTIVDTPMTVGDYVDPADFPSVLAEIQDDGKFFVRLNRTGGDYFVKSATVLLDANLVPEPSAAALFVAAAVCLAIWLRVKPVRLATCSKEIEPGPGRQQSWYAS